MINLLISIEMIPNTIKNSVSNSTTNSVSVATSVFAVCAKLLVSSHPNIDSLSNAVIYSFFASQSTCPQLDNKDLKQIDVDDLEEMDLRWQIAMLTMRARRFLQKTGINLGDNRVTSMGFDMSKVECYNCHRRDILLGSVGLLRTQEEEEPANFSLMAITSSSSSFDNNVPSCSKACLESVEARLVVYKQNESILEKNIKLLNEEVQLSPSKPAQDLSHTNRPTAPIIEDWVSDYKDESETNDQNDPHSVLSFVQSSEQVKTPRHSVQPVEAPILNATCKPTSLKFNSSSKRRNRKTCFVCRSVDHLIKDYDYHTKKKGQPIPRNYAHRGYNKQHALFTHKHSPKHMVPAAVLTQSKPVSITAVRPVCAAVPKIMVTRPRHAHSIDTKSKSPIRRYIICSPFLKASNSPPRVTAAQAPVVSTTKGNPQYALKDKGVIDSGCSRHMTWNMSYLSDFKELNGGFVSFRGNPKGGKIPSKGKIKTVLFTDTECLVLSPDFKLPDESQVLLRLLRENNMYNVNLKNIVPSGDLTCLFAKATIDESNIWHRRLGHINFKTINKLVKGNLVRELPTKVFEINNTCVACKKGKQHRASCKTKPVSSIDQPLFRLHMNLFGPTFVKSLNKKSYYFVITDDYSRFTWMFFLATKNETSPILKTFITSIENQLSLKVKVIRSDNGTEFKNFDLNQFCENRVLVTKPHNKTPYELLHGRTPSIGFMRPFGCLVTILNTLDPLGKFKGKFDEGFFVGYSVNSKAFRVFNSRIRNVQETLHVNFLENNPNITTSGLTWLFDIDSLTRTMNYQLVTTKNESNLSAGFQDKFDAEKAKEEVTQQYMLFPVWSSGSLNPQNKDGDATFDGKKHGVDTKKPESAVNVSPSSSVQLGKQDDKTNKKAKGNSYVESFIENRDLGAEFEDHSNNNSNDVNATGSIVPTAGPTHGKSSFKDASQLPKNLDMLEMEDITFSDHENVCVEADFNNLETSITVNPIPTTRTHKDHPISQIIGDLSSTTQTRSMSRVIKDQGGLSQIFIDDFHSCMFACFLSQEGTSSSQRSKAIGTKWVYRNKMDERGIVVRNKARLVAQGHIQEEGINYEEVFPLVARIEAIRLILAYASFMGCMVYQMDVKSVFLYGTIKEEVYVFQPPGFKDLDHSDKAYKVIKILYGLHQCNTFKLGRSRIMIRGERKPQKGQNQIKTGQKWEAWRNQKKLEAVTVDRGRKTEENAKKRAKFANSYK
nr:hypothetical protein [Tanacetum cinerariifolium]